MQLALSDKKFREVVEDALIDILLNKPELLKAILADVVEDACLSAAIKEGRKDEFIPEQEIMALLTKKVNPRLKSCAALR